MIHSHVREIVQLTFYRPSYQCATGMLHNAILSHVYNFMRTTVYQSFPFFSCFFFLHKMYFNKARKILFTWHQDVYMTQSMAKCRSKIETIDVSGINVIL